MVTPRYELLDTALKDTSLQQYPAATIETFNADIRPQPDDSPLIAAAGVRLLQAYYVIEVYFRDHVVFTFMQRE